MGRTAGLSTALRSGRDDKIIKQRTSVSWGRKSAGRHNFVVSTGAQRSGETCGLFSGEISWSPKNLTYRTLIHTQRGKDRALRASPYLHDPRTLVREEERMMQEIFRL